jgi:hypothetical protein
MKLFAFVVVAGLALWFIGSRIIDRGNDVNALAQASENNINSVAEALREATENDQKGSSDETSWQGKVNALCSDAATALHTLGRPRNVEEIAAYLDKALHIVQRNHARLASLPQPEALASQAKRAGAALMEQERMLRRVRAAARKGHSTRMLHEIDRLRSLARAENPNLIKLGISDCTLPSWGVPL